MRQSTARLLARCQNSGERARRVVPASGAWGAAAVMAIAASSFCRADTVTLRTGAIVRGRVLDATAALGHRPASKAEREQAAHLVAVSTLTGGRLILSSGEVGLISKRPLVLEEYEMRKRHTNNDVESQWRLAEWCKGRGLKPQREEALRAVLVLDPDNLPAHQGLGQTKRDGQWRTYDEEMRSRGFVKFEGRYVAQQEVDILKRAHQRKRQDQDWLERVRSAVRSLASGDGEKRRRGMETLLKLNDAEAIPALNRVLLASNDESLRELYVHVMSAIQDVNSATPALVDVALFDHQKSVRVAAQEAITERSRPTAAALFARQLHNADNEIVRRSGLMLEKLGDPSVIPQLIEALITTHGVTQQVVDNSSNYGFSRGGGPTGGLPPDVYTKMVTGQYPNGVQVVTPDGPMTGANVKTVVVDREYRNAEVLAALQSITKQSFGFDKDSWRRWWGAKRTAGPYKPPNT
jgi:broad specificity phosphatase PhoE